MGGRRRYACRRRRRRRRRRTFPSFRNIGLSQLRKRAGLLVCSFSLRSVAETSSPNPEHTHTQCHVCPQVLQSHKERHAPYPLRAGGGSGRGRGQRHAGPAEAGHLQRHPPPLHHGQRRSGREGVQQLAPARLQDHAVGRGHAGHGLPARAQVPEERRHDLRRDDPRRGLAAHAGGGCGRGGRDGAGRGESVEERRGGSRAQRQDRVRLQHRRAEEQLGSEARAVQTAAGKSRTPRRLVPAAQTSGGPRPEHLRHRNTDPGRLRAPGPDV